MGHRRARPWAPELHRHERSVKTQSEELDCRRTRLYGEVLRSYVERWDLLARGTDMVVPERLYSAPLPVVGAYLRSIFQAEGFVSARSASTVVEVDIISELLIRGVQQLLLRFGIFARVGFKPDARDSRKGCWTVRARPLATGASSLTRSGSSTLPRPTSWNAASSCRVRRRTTPSNWRSPGSSRWAPWKSSTSRPRVANTSPATSGCTTVSSWRLTTRWTRSWTGTRKKA